MKKKRRVNYKICHPCACLTAAMLTSQVLQPTLVLADSLKLAGTTQMATTDRYLEIDTFATALTVEEVYAVAGDYLEVGDPILKFTSDSYQEALDYYEAAILRAQNSLTDTQLAYDQGILDVQYTYEKAIADSENAEFIKEYQTDEVASAISDHEEILDEIEEKITELNAGIADGSYDTANNSASSTNTGASASGASGNASQKTDQEGSEKGSEKDSDEDPKSEVDDEDDKEIQKPEDADEGNPNESEDRSENTLEELKKEFSSKTSEIETLEEKILCDLEEISEKFENDMDSSNSEDYASYVEQLKNIIDEMTEDINIQKNVQSMLTEENKEEITEILDSSVQGNARVLESLQDISVRLNKYQMIIQFALGILDTGSDMVAVDAEFLSNISAYISLQQECNDLCTKLIEYYESEQTEDIFGSGDTESKDLSEESTSEKDVKTTDSSSGKTSGGDTSRSSASGDSASGGSSGMTSPGTGGSGGSIETQAGGKSGQMEASEADISLLGDTYDLTAVKNALSKEPSDSEDAQDSLNELEDFLEEIEGQYKELLRNKKIFELEIQHTYDTAVIEARLAEFTYKAEMEEWEETLEQAKQTKADMEEQKAFLETMADGIITADRSGTVASVSYEEEDTIAGEIPVISYYDTDTVTVTVEIGQNDISKLAVGDTVEVTLGGMMKCEGTVREKSVEPESGTSRTTINYTAIICIDNENGNLSSGMSAEVTISSDNDVKIDRTGDGEEAADEE